jgi:hypothetical protein
MWAIAGISHTRIGATKAVASILNRYSESKHNTGLAMTRPRIQIVPHLRSLALIS